MLYLSNQFIIQLFRMNITNNTIKGKYVSINIQGNMTNLNIFNNNLYANSTTNTHRHTITVNCDYYGNNDIYTFSIILLLKQLE